MKHFLCVVGMAALLACSASAEIRIVVTGQDRHPVDHRLFGVMLERADWDGEGGAENAWDRKRNAWRPGIVPLWDRMGATTLRFPGGGLVDRYDWRWGIDNVPDREGPRPITERADTPEGVKYLLPGTEPRLGVETHYLGTDEAYELCLRTGTDLVLVVNVLWFKDDYERGARLAADWVEYCNSPNDDSNPNGGVNWAAIRAKNGHPKPFGVRLWEIGNETWLLPRFPQDAYGKQVAVYADAMRKVDPAIEIIADGQSPELRRSVAQHAGKRVQYVAFHHYEPWGVNLQGFQQEAAWNAAAGLPSQPWNDWLNTFRNYVRESGHGYKAALTEWNIHGWHSAGWNPRSWSPTLPKYVPFGLSMAAWFNDLLRHADLIPVAHVSMLLGTEWSNTLIRYNWDPERTSVGFFSYHVFRLYAQNTGDRYVDASITGCPVYRSDRPFGNSPPRGEVPYLDVAVTRSDSNLYIHIVNRHPSENLPVVLDLKAFPQIANVRGVMTWLQPATILAEPFWDSPGAIAPRATAVRSRGTELRTAIPARSVSVIQLPLHNTP